MHMAQLSNEALARELLAPVTIAKPGVCVLTARDVENDPTNGLIVHGHPALKHKLGIARELLLRDLAAAMQRGPVFDSPQVLREWLRLYCARIEHEVFLVLYLDAHHALFEAEEMFRGTLTQTSVYPREIVKGALRRNAAAVAFAHPHPSSGCAEPSRADEFLTSTLRHALNLVDVRVIDHFIVSGNAVLSMAERGLV
ncbi:JAB domain-containing protein [Sphaerotilus sp.]|uniref:JAB domain-containing protein n=1 Tax=Sphaerotilus sp. TaxID=2093942 RepID=UPI003A0FBA3A